MALLVTHYIYLLRSHARYVHQTPRSLRTLLASHNTKFYTLLDIFLGPRTLKQQQLCWHTSTGVTTYRKLRKATLNSKSLEKGLEPKNSDADTAAIRYEHGRL
jgi:hypothetical protein